MKQLCSWGKGVKVLPDGFNELDACVYEDIEQYKNVTVIISRCKKCGHIEVSWIRQDNTEKVEDINE